MSAPSYSKKITTEATSWPGVEALPHRFGGIEFRLGRRELGHVHGESIADLPLRRELRDQLIADGRAQVHRWRPDSGWVTIPLTGEEAVGEVIALLRDSYERAQRARERHARS